MLQQTYIFSFTHKKFLAEELACLYIEPLNQAQILQDLKQKMNWEELLYIGTCNRVELIFVSKEDVTSKTMMDVVHQFTKNTLDDASVYAEKTNLYRGFDAVRHLFRVASSLDSLVVGEREIITQVRTSFEFCDSLGLCGDTIRLMAKKTIEVGKAVYTHTHIAKNPVSVVSLAFHKLISAKNITKQSKIVLVGAGQIITAFARTLKKNEFTNLLIFNRTLAKAQKLAQEVGAQAYVLDDLYTYSEGFDVLVSCTGSEHPTITSTVFENNPSDVKRHVFDLALPFDISRNFSTLFNLHITGLETLKELAEKNLQERQKEVERCEVIIEDKIREFKHVSKQRKVDLAMRAVPDEVKNIKKTALSEVFAHDIESLDANSKEVLDKILTYMEKKYIRVPMKMAREILLDTEV